MTMAMVYMVEVIGDRPGKFREGFPKIVVWTWIALTIPMTKAQSRRVCGLAVGQTYSWGIFRATRLR